MDEFMLHYEKIYPRMYRTAYYYLKNAQEAEDAVGDTVLTAYEKWDQLRDKEKFDCWIMKILVNRCKKRMKGWFRRDEAIDELTPERERSLSKETDFAMDSAVKEAFFQLKEEERLIVALSVLGGFTGKEMADILNKNHSTIRSKYRRAIQKMRENLEV